jgi:hypothetical protein
MVILQKSLKKLQQNATTVLRIQNNGAVIAHFKHLKDLGMKPAM